jgi:hypothetical protein
MSDGEGWIQRVFGGKPGSPRTETLEEALVARDRVLAERQQAIVELEQRLAGVETELGMRSEQARVREGELTRALENAAAAHDALAAELERSESSRAAEFAQARRQLDSVQAVLQGVREELASAKSRLGAREGELAKKAEQLTDSEWRNQTLEGEIARVRADEPKQRALKASANALQRDLETARAERAQRDAQIQELQTAERARQEQLSELERNHTRSVLRIEELEAGLGASEGLLRDREARLTQLRALLFELSRLCAGGLHAAFGEALHLGVELSASRGWQPSLDAAHDPAELVQQLRKQLGLLGVAEDVRLELSGSELRGELRLSSACAPSEARALARWAAAYAIECVNLVLPAPLRLDELSPAGDSHVFTASARAGAASPELADPGSSGTRVIAQNDRKPVRGVAAR